MSTPVATLVGTGGHLADFARCGNGLSLGQTQSDWQDLNSRPLDPLIGPPQISGVNYLSLVSMVDR